jgi:hypothetical protein
MMVAVIFVGVIIGTCMKIIFSLVMILASSMSFAVTIYCSGKIKNVFIESDGNVHVMGSWATDRYAKICNLNDSDVVTCSMWTSVISTAVKENLDVIINYKNSEYTCDTLPEYAAAPKPSYIMLRNGI